MLSVDLPVSLKVSLRLSPFSRLMPLKDASCAVVVICAMMSLYWLTRLARMACEAASATGATGSAERRSTAPSRADGNRTDRGRSAVVGRGEDELVGAVQAGRQIAGRQGGVQLIERLAGADGDGECRQSAAWRRCMIVWPALMVAPSTRLAAVPPSAAAEVTVDFGRIAGRRLQHLVGDRFRGIDQLLQRGDAGVGGLQHLHAVADAVEQLLMSLARLLRPCAVK